MIQQYPHFLFVKSVSESIQDENGNWSESTEQWVLRSVCREQTNGKGSLINGQDGKSIVFASIVHLPLSAERIIEGTLVKVCAANDADAVGRIEKQILKFDVGQLHCRLWV